VRGDSQLVTSHQLQILNEIWGWNGFLWRSTPDLRANAREILINPGFCPRMPLKPVETPLSRPSQHVMQATVGMQNRQLNMGVERFWRFHSTPFLPSTLEPVRQ